MRIIQLNYVYTYVTGFLYDWECCRRLLLTTSHGINQDISVLIYKEAPSKAYTIENIKAAFKVTGISPLNPQGISQLLKPTAKSRSEFRANTTCILENIPYTKHDLRQQFSSLSNSTPFMKPIFLVQSYSIRSKISDFQRRICDSLAKPRSMNDDLKSDSSKYKGAR